MAAARPAPDAGNDVGARVEAVVLDEQAGAGSLGRHGERDGRVQAAHALMSRRPGDPQHRSLVEGEHPAVPVPPKPHCRIGPLSMANRCPASSLKSFGISQRRSDPGR